MKLNEILYREIAIDFLNNKNKFTQKELSVRLGISLGNINKAVSNLQSINAVKIEKRSFNIIAFDKLLLYWATHRKLDKDIIYRSVSDLKVSEIENTMPNGIAFTAYTAYKKIYNTAPADYSEVFVYAVPDAVNIIKKRFQKQGKFPNIIVLNADKILSKRIINEKINAVPIPNLFVDLWNIRTWYAKEFIDALSKNIFS